jgi:hypothetical protein
LIAATYNERQKTICIWRSEVEEERWTRGADSITAGRWSTPAPPLLAVGTTIAVRQPDGAWRQTAAGETGMRRVASNGTVIVTLGCDGVWRSGDYGLTWSRDATRFPHDQIMDVVLDDSDLFILLTGDRRWSRPL